MKRVPKSETNAEAYDHHHIKHIITLAEDDATVSLAVDVFDDGSVHIYDDNDPTESQVCLLSAEADALLAILQSRPK